MKTYKIYSDKEYLFPLLRGDKGCVILLRNKRISHTPCPLSRGEKLPTDNIDY